MFDKIKKMLDVTTDAVNGDVSENTAKNMTEALQEEISENPSETMQTEEVSPWERIAEENARAEREEDAAFEIPESAGEENTEPEIPAETAQDLELPETAEEVPQENDETDESGKESSEEKTEKKKPVRTGFYTDKNSFFINAAFWLLLLSVVFTLIGSTGLWQDSYSVKTLLLLPMASSVLYALCVRFLGKKTLWLSVIPFLGGAAYFVLYALNCLPLLYIIITCALCAGAVAVYFLTVIYKIKNRWILLISFCAVFFYRLLAEDMGLIGNYSFVFISFSDGIRELAVLCMLLSVLLVAIGLKHRQADPDLPELPKIKTPHAVIPASDDNAG